MALTRFEIALILEVSLSITSIFNAEFFLSKQTNNKSPLTRLEDREASGDWKI